ncbi:N-6 DNA methylase [Candidatus Albibeggiatoa sp. nov. NOAA]|uniref:N-6 DNA methylase n=1 Tax=Candidatus Albibeggiatoa sp. nov. NOAA TaxID=3162724 RepID=UPI0032F18164|nr:N-6 DNA methylase [Thiotrichaceae bacterium]
MLDTETKRRIDTARDILVGKIPDPKSQVEQITIALIYKFMDDMDKEAEELGGERQFFVDDYADYRWENLIGLGIGGQQALELYEAGIRAMPENENLPKLFRDIFKNAYLPYRDPETLRHFLKVINEFEYDHSERLGDAFEYLLSVLGSQGDAGQFRTPRHIIDFIVRVIDPKKGETVLDPACGTAGFLIAAYKHILDANSHNGRSTLTIDERKALVKAVQGYDISPDMVRLSLVNLYLHGFSQPLIDEYDTLTSDVKWNEFADVILANPPFMSPKGGIKPHKRFSVQSKRSEVLFVDYIAEHLHSNGRAGVIVPEGIIFQSQKAYKQLRKLLVSDYLYAVVSLPAGVFQPYSGVKTSILLMDKGLSKRSDSILFVKVEQDGFDLGAQRRAIAGDDLPMAEQVLQGFREACLAGEAFDTADYDNAWVVEKSKIGEDGEWNLSGERYVEFKSYQNIIHPLITINELYEIEYGLAESIPKNLDDKGIKIISTAELELDGSLDLSKIRKITRNDKYSKYLLPPNTLLFNWRNAPKHVGKTAYFMESGEYIYASFLLALHKKTEANVENKYVWAMLNSLREKGYFKSQARQAVNQTNFNATQLKATKIPLPPLEIQQAIVKEIEGYQKIIDGARTVVENYKPQIQIDPDWEVVELGKVCEIKSGGTPNRKSKEYWDGDIPWVTTTLIDFNEISYANEYITTNGLNNSSTWLVPKGTILVAMYGQGITRGKVAILGIDATINQACAAFQLRSEILLNQYLFRILQVNYDNLRRVSENRGGNQSNLSAQTLKQYKIPIPPLETQTQIVAQIENEQALVDANKELITLFEQKIKDTIERVWQT